MGEKKERGSVRVKEMKGRMAEDGMMEREEVSFSLAQPCTFCSGSSSKLVRWSISEPYPNIQMSKYPNLQFAPQPRIFASEQHAN